MAISTVQIANFALSKIGSDSTIESLTENSAEANVCNLWIDHARKQALAAFNWDFARVRGTLATHGDDAPTEWTYRYVYPADCVKARFIYNPLGRKDNPVPYEVEQSDNGTKSIVTDQVDAILVYTKDENTPSLYTDWFIELLATALGSKIAYALTGKRNLQRALGAEARFMAIMAPSVDAVEQEAAPLRDADHIRERD